MIAGTAAAPLLAAGISGGLNLLGGIFQQDNAAKQVQQQENFQERMSSTAYQRAAADAKAAGLNPILVPALGGGESTPPGAMFQPENIVGQAGSSAIQAAQALKQTQLVDSQTYASTAQGDLNNALSAKAGAESRYLDDLSEWTKSSAKAIDYENVQSQLEAEMAKAHPDAVKAAYLTRILLAPVAHGASAAAKAGATVGIF